LQRLAGIRMSPEVEAAALEALKAPDPAALRDALHVLRLYGSPQSKGILLRHFREWHEAWVSRAKELESPANRERASIDLAFFEAIGAAQGWLCSEEELLSLQEMCVTETCKERAAGLIRCWKSVQFTIQFAEPVGDEVVERIGMGRYQGVISTMDRLKQKLTQYPRGSVFRLDTSWSDHELADRIYAELKPWAALNGFELRK